MMSSFRAVFRKEMLHLRRNKAVAWLAIMMPLMQMTMYGFIDQTVHDEPTIIVDQDRSVQSRELSMRCIPTRSNIISRLCSRSHQLGKSDLTFRAFRPIAAAAIGELRKRLSPWLR